MVFVQSNLSYSSMVVLCVVCAFIHSFNQCHSFIHSRSHNVVVMYSVVATSRAGCVFCCGIFSLHFFGSINYYLNISPRAHSSDWNSAISVSCADVQVR